VWGILGMIGELVVDATYDEDPVAFPIDASVIDLTKEDRRDRGWTWGNVSWRLPDRVGILVSAQHPEQLLTASRFDPMAWHPYKNKPIPGICFLF
jgi:hypothetical protein